MYAYAMQPTLQAVYVHMCYITVIASCTLASWLQMATDISLLQRAGRGSCMPVAHIVMRPLPGVYGWCAQAMPTVCRLQYRTMSELIKPMSANSSAAEPSLLMLCRSASSTLPGGGRGGGGRGVGGRAGWKTAAEK